MIYLDFTKIDSEKREEIVEEFCKKILLGRRKIKDIDDWCKKYLKVNPEKEYKFEDVIKATPEELMKLKKYLDGNYDITDIMKEFYSATASDNRRCYIVDTLYEGMNVEAKKKLLESLNVVVCPYCNRNYVYSEEDINTCELDHFLPKDKYPIFAVSFYNLIPVCPVCNRKKSDKMFWFYPHHTSRELDVVEFSYHVKGSDYLSNLEQIEVDVKVINDYYNDQLKELELKKIYKHHRDIVQDVLKKNQVFSDAYIENFCGEFPEVFSSKKEVEELIYGTPMDAKDYGKRPLTKLTQDIVNEIKRK